MAETAKNTGNVDKLLKQTDALRKYLEKEGYQSVEQIVLFMDTLKESIISLATGDLEKAGDAMKRLSSLGSSELFKGIGEVTRELHESIKEIQGFLEPILHHFTEKDIEGLSSKLNHVSDLVKDTSEKTLDLLFSRQEVALSDNVEFDRLSKLIVAGDQKAAMKKIRELKSHNSELLQELMKISELQIHSDLVDQIIRKVSVVVDNIESRLVELLKKYGHNACVNLQEAPDKDGATLHGPAIPGKDKGAASSQDDVDGLLKSLGL